MSDSSVPANGDGNRATAAYVVVWVEAGLALVVVALRMWARITIKALGPDDYLILFSLALLIVSCALLTLLGSLGGFRHMYYLRQESQSTLIDITRINYIVQGVITFAYAPSKTSVGLLVLRIIGKKQGPHEWFKRVIYAILVLVWASTIVCVVMIYAQCNPTASLWDFNITDKTCWDSTLQPKFGIFTSAVNILCDLILAAIPCLMIFRLHIDMRKRVSLCILLGLGVLAAVSAVVKTTYLLSLAEHADITWEDYSLIMWATSELFIIIFCGSIPPISPLWNRYITKRSPEVPTDYQKGSAYFTFGTLRRNSDVTHVALTDVGSPNSNGYNKSQHRIYTRTDIEITSTRNSIVESNDFVHAF